jgi:hypothetical protein
MSRRLLHKAYMLKCSQRGSRSTLSLNFSQITKTSLRGEGKRCQRLKDEYFCWWNQQPLKEGRGGGKLLYYPSKINHWKLASRNRNIQFWNRNICNSKYSHYRQNRTLRFVKPGCLVFSGSVRSIVYEAIVFYSSHLAF